GWVRPSAPPSDPALAAALLDGVVPGPPRCGSAPGQEPMDLAVAHTALVLIVPVELPDKTFVATLVLATRYRPLLVWIGVGLAFFVQTLVAVTARRLISRLPHRPVRAFAALMFLIGGIVLLRGAKKADEEEAETEAEFGAKVTK